MLKRPISPLKIAAIIAVLVTPLVIWFSSPLREDGIMALAQQIVVALMFLPFVGGLVVSGNPHDANYIAVAIFLFVELTLIVWSLILLWRKIVN